MQLLFLSAHFCVFQNRLNNYTGPVGFGVYHTGVEVHGTGKKLKLNNELKIYPIASYPTIDFTKVHA